MVRDSIRPDVTMFVHYETQEIDGKQILAVTVQKGTGRPYYLASKGLKPSGVYVRNGTSSDPATDTAIRKMIKETDGDCFEDMRSLEQNLTFDAAKAQFAKCDVPLMPLKCKRWGWYRRMAFTPMLPCFSLTNAAVSSSCHLFRYR